MSDFHKPLESILAHSSDKETLRFELADFIHSLGDCLALELHLFTSGEREGRNRTIQKLRVIAEDIAYADT